MKIKIILFIFAVCFFTAKGEEFSLRLKLKSHSVEVQKSSPAFRNILSKYTVKEDGFKPARPGAKNPDLLLYYTMRCSGNSDEVIRELNATGLFSYIKKGETAYATACSNPSVPNDYIDRYYHDVIQAQCAWSITKGNPNVLIGIADTDFDTGHEDLQNQIAWIGGPVSAGNGHGAMVAGTAAAETNNNLGIAGIGYNSKIAAHRIRHSIVIINNRPVTTANSLDIGDAIWNLYEMHVPVINVSWTTTGLDVATAREITENGTVIVTTAGNSVESKDSINAILHPQHEAIGAVPGVIIVGGTGYDDNHIVNYHHSRFVDLCAPALGFYVLNMNNTYTDNIGGTSLGAPLVSGTIALMLSVNPDLTPVQIEAILKATTDPIPNAGDFPGLVGTGRLNAYAAVQAACATAAQSVNFTNQIVTTDMTVTSCGDINVENVQVKNGAKLTLDAAGNVNLGSGFEVELGSEFEILQ